MNKHHISREYDAELHVIRHRLIAMAEHVGRMINEAVLALQDSNLELAKHVIEEDRRVNREEIELDELCLQLIARRQPVGSDLRLITTALKMVTDLERIGDLTVNIAERVIAIKSAGLPVAHANLDLMQACVTKMLCTVVDAFVNDNVEDARRTLEQDCEVDRLYHETVRDLLKRMLRDETLIEPLIHLQTVAKWLERIGDHCTNLAELVVFMVEGTDIRHVGKLG